MEIRKPNVAGTFYAADKLALASDIKNYLNQAAKSPSDLKNKKIKALISPHAGYIYSGSVAGAGYKLISGQNYENVILLGPSHFVEFNFAALDNADIWQTPLGNVKINQSLNKKLLTDNNFQIAPKVFTKEHSLEVQVPFLQSALTDFTLIPIGCGQNLNHQKIANQINQILNEDILVVASSDLSHYLPIKTAEKVDKESIASILSLDNNKMKQKLEACGSEDIFILNELAVLNNWKPYLVDWRTSAETSGDPSAVVGYTSIAYIS